MFHFTFSKAALLDAPQLVEIDVQKLVDEFFIWQFVKISWHPCNVQYLHYLDYRLQATVNGLFRF